MNKPEFTIRLRAPADPTDRDGTRRLRAALKRLWRGYGLRCLECRPTVPPDLDSTGETAPESTEPPENKALATWDKLKEEAKERKREGGRHKDVENLPQAEPGARGNRADVAANVASRTIPQPCGGSEQ